MLVEKLSNFPASVIIEVTVGTIEHPFPAAVFYNTKLSIQFYIAKNPIV
jgi:hypothetical protein